MIVRDAKNFDIISIGSRAIFVEHKSDSTFGIEGSMLAESRYAHISFDASRIVPTSSENKPYTTSAIILITY